MIRFTGFRCRSWTRPDGRHPLLWFLAREKRDESHTEMVQRCVLLANVYLSDTVDSFQAGRWGIFVRCKCGWTTLAKEGEPLGLSWKMLLHYDSEHESLKETIGLDPGRAAQGRL